jgi:hypothetical protein
VYHHSSLEIFRAAFCLEFSISLTEPGTSSDFGSPPI